MQAWCPYPHPRRYFTGKIAGGLPERPEIDNSCLCRSRILPRRNPLCDRTVFRTAREADPSPEFGSRPRTLGLFPRIKFTPSKAFHRMNWGISARRKITRIDSAWRSPRRHSFMEREIAWVCNAENYVPPATYRLRALTRSETRHRLTPIHPTNAKPAQLDETASHFLRIGVPSAQRVAVPPIGRVWRRAP
jgi:hypothetical protein